MINFFRKTRKKLADDNKLFKYSRYAIGEIVLVVIGILIALSINNWNEDGKNRRIEKEILIDLKEEFIANKQRILQAIEQRKSLQIPIEIYMKLMSESKVRLEDFNEIHENSLFTPRINPSYGVINSIISSGDIKLISNDSLKYLITEWKDILGSYQDVEQTSWEGHRRLSEYLDKQYPVKGNQFYNGIPQELYRKFEYIIRDVEYSNRMVVLKNHLGAAIRIGLSKIDYIERVIDLINQEVEKFK